MVDLAAVYSGRPYLDGIARAAPSNRADLLLEKPTIDFDVKEAELRHRLQAARRRRQMASVAETDGSPSEAFRNACADVTATEALIEDLGAQRAHAEAQRLRAAEEARATRNREDAVAYAQELRWAVTRSSTIDVLTARLAEENAALKKGLDRAHSLRVAWMSNDDRKQEKASLASSLLNFSVVTDWIENALSRAQVLPDRALDASYTSTLLDLMRGRVARALTAARAEFPHLPEPQEEAV